MHTFYQQPPFIESYDLTFEDSDVPLSGITCQIQECTVTIKSASLKIIAVLPTSTQRLLPSRFEISQFKVKISKSNEPVKGRWSLVIWPYITGQPVDKRLLKCLHVASLLQGKRCSTLLFERALRDAAPNSCHFTHFDTISH